MIIGLSLIHVQFLLVWANNVRILIQSIRWLNSLFVLDVYMVCVIRNSFHFTSYFLETNLPVIFSFQACISTVAQV